MTCLYRLVYELYIGMSYTVGKLLTSPINTHSLKFPVAKVSCFTVEEIDTIEPIDVVENIEEIEDIDSIESVDVVENIEDIEEIDSVESIDVVENIEDIRRNR